MDSNKFALEKITMFLVLNIEAHRDKHLKYFDTMTIASKDRKGRSLCDQETYEARRVIIPHGLGIPKGLQKGIGADDLIFQSPLSKKTREEGSLCL